MKTAEQLPFFMLGEASEITGVRPSLVTNWTIGRPLRLIPSIAAHGTGSRNLYRPHDLYRIGIAAQMSADRMGTDIIQAVVDKLGESILEASLIVVRSSLAGQMAWNHDPHPVIEILTSGEAQKFNRTPQIISNSQSCYFLNVALIVETVDRLMQAFIERRKADRQSKKTRVLATNSGDAAKGKSREGGGGPIKPPTRRWRLSE